MIHSLSIRNSRNVLMPHATAKSGSLLLQSSGWEQRHLNWLTCGMIVMPENHNARRLGAYLMTAPRAELVPILTLSRGRMVREKSMSLAVEGQQIPELAVKTSTEHGMSPTTCRNCRNCSRDDFWQHDRAVAYHPPDRHPISAKGPLKRLRFMSRPVTVKSRFCTITLLNSWRLGKKHHFCEHLPSTKAKS